MTVCDLCGYSYNCLRQHLKKGHNIINSDELDLLIMAMTARGYKGKLPCDPCRRNFTRLDKHFRCCHSEWTPQQQRDMFKQAVKKRAIEGLRSLRATMPDVPMVSTLDVTADDLNNIPPDPVLPSGNAASNAAAPSSSHPTPVPSTSASPSGQCPGCRVRDESLRRIRHNNSMLRLRIKELIGAKKAERRKKHQKRRDPVSDEENESPGYERLLSQYAARINTEGATTKEKSNAQQRVQSVRQFLVNAAKGHVPHKSLVYLGDHSGLRHAIRTWRDAGLKPTTIKKMIIDVQDFLKWIRRAWPQGVRLSQRKLEGLKEELSRELRNLRGSVMTHVVNVRRQKSENIFPLSVHRTFIKKSNALLEKYFNIAMKTKSRENIHRFQSLLAGLIISETGHRITVLRNMRVQEVEEARPAGSCLVIHVKEHKTRATCGDVPVAVDRRVYACMKKWLEKREALRGWGGPYIFSSSTGGRAPVLLEVFKKIWIDLGLPAPAPTFNGLTSSVATHVDGHKMADSMCHDLGTSQKYYQACPPPTEIATVRVLIMKKMVGEMAEEENEEEENGEEEG